MKRIDPDDLAPLLFAIVAACFMLLIWCDIVIYEAALKHRMEAQHEAE